LTHPAPQRTGFAEGRTLHAVVAICQRYVDTVNRVTEYPPCIPPAAPAHRQALRSTGSARHARSPASSLLWLTPTPEPRPAGLLLRWPAVPPECSHIRSRRVPRHCTREPGEFGFGFSGADRVLMEGLGSPRFLDNPNVNMPCSPTPAGVAPHSNTGAPHAAFRSLNNVGSRLTVISWLNHTAY
jgi:hypothetical protein